MHTHQWPSYATEYYPYQGEAAAITVTMKYSPLGFLLGLFTPVLVIDGQPIPAGWRRPIATTVVPGQHHVHAHVPYLIPRRIGKADLVVTAMPGQNVDLEYRAPLIVFMRGALGAGPQKYPGLVASILLLVVTLLLALCSFGGTLVMNRYAAQLASTSEADRPIPPLPELPESAPPLPNLPEPAEERPARRLTGATFEPGEKTFTMRFKDWPFAFRTPPTWGCLGARTDIPDSKAYICVDEGDPGSGKRLAVLLRACPAPCGAKQQNTLGKNWFRAGEKPRKFDATTKFLEVEKNRYQLVMSHFFGTEPKWQVAVDATAPVKARSEMQKVVNDILTQTS
ncbi:hypothetical protein [Actinoplanes aureus]|uniref:Uncharacterized protein n=1 Tax=Actinoplanes aureus TaxID=2792083 RepID=A0A931CFQ0_9ACTN|nr:hypothetical protein [Actinoplanes aureus]MBG0565691.1 hypothetical protein [Actinoplanes aureus]